MEHQNGMEKENKIALLSNINMNSLIRMLSREHTVYEAEGYGNELGLLMNPASSYHGFDPEITFLLMDLMELLEHDPEPETAREKIKSWFQMLEGTLKPSGIYYISDAWLTGVELDGMHDTSVIIRLEMIWQEALEKLAKARENVRIFPYRRMMNKLGEENAISMKMWYMGKILLSNQAQKLLCQEILACVKQERQPAKKVLLLDLDNTLWGGLAGEAEHTPVELSEDHVGLAYKNLQRVILQMQRQGVLLGIVSKNNPEDAEEILQKHPHMVLQPEHFAVKKINWKPKQENILEIAAELNLGVDSFVFFDDNPGERTLVREMLPQCVVPEFPEKPEELATVMVEIYRNYFRKPVVTAEDLNKTGQYAANAKREQLQRQAMNFEEYLEGLQIRARRVDPAAHAERLTQLLNKTNQFNLTTRRYTQAEIGEILQDFEKKVYLYRVEDRFGDNGIVAALIVNRGCVEDFVMSCRIMGRNIEYALMEDVEQDMRLQGVDVLEGSYLPTPKNKPVADLYDRLGYERVEETAEGSVRYRLNLKEAPVRQHFVSLEKDS